LSADRLRRIAILDGGSFALPYDHELIGALTRQGAAVDFYASRTRYNAHFLEALRAMPGVRVVARAVSRTAAPRWRGALNYLLLLGELWRERRGLDVVNLQFSVLWPIELPLLWALRRRFMFTVHNAVPHGFARPRHRPTAWLAALARTLVFASEATRDDFARRYGARLLAKSVVLAHGLVPVEPGLSVVAYRPLRPTALVFWSTVKPYKGVELFAELARSEVFRGRGLGLEIHGAWAPELTPLRAEMERLGVQVDDRYLDADGLRRLLGRDVLFVLPYVQASQSGALYTLLHHGCHFLCTDVGDPGAFLRRHGLQELLIRERSAQAVLACLDHLQAHAEAVAVAFTRAQAQCAWDAVLQPAQTAYLGP
jgi:glycosyltransferase involved in cell wall biosynthesis